MSNSAVGPVLNTTVSRYKTPKMRPFSATVSIPQVKDKVLFSEWDDAKITGEGPSDQCGAAEVDLHCVT